jgi:hypothetical protein
MQCAVQYSRGQPARGHSSKHGQKNSARATLMSGAGNAHGHHHVALLEARPICDRTRHSFHVGNTFFLPQQYQKGPTPHLTTTAPNQCSEATASWIAAQHIRLPSSRLAQPPHAPPAAPWGEGALLEDTNLCGCPEFRISHVIIRFLSPMPKRKTACFLPRLVVLL